MTSDTTQPTLHQRSPHIDALTTVKRGMNPNVDEAILKPSKSSQDESSLPDSGYGSNLPSPDQSENRDKEKRIVSFPQKAIPFPLPTHKDLLVFKKDVNPKAVLRFNEIIPEIERLLLSHIKSSSRFFSGPARHEPMAIRLMVLGKSEDSAKEHMVVFCPATFCKRVQQFFNKQRIVKELCEPSDPAVPSFKVVVNGQAPRLRSSLLEIQVLCAALQPSSNTFCGRPIRLVNDSGDVRYATFGGVVKVNGSDGGFKLYGLTTSHSLLEWQEPGTPTVEPPNLGGESNVEEWEAGEDDSDDEISEHLLESEDPFAQESTIPDKPEKNVTASAWSFAESEELGKIVKLPQVAGSSQQYFDWALFELNKCMPNLLVRTESSGIARKHTLIVSVEAMTPDFPSRDVIMLGASRGSKSGVLSKLPGRIKIGPGESFTDAYMLTLNEGSVSDGDSGSWVVDPVTCEVYGHVVATDMFGDAYVIPIDGILEDMKRHLGAESVDLPSDIDFSILALNSDSAFFNPFDKSLNLFDASYAATEQSSNNNLPNPASLGFMPMLPWHDTVAGVHPPWPSAFSHTSGLFSDMLSSDSGYNSLDTTPTSYSDPPTTDSGYHTLDPSPLGPTPEMSPPKRRSPVSSKDKKIKLDSDEVARPPRRPRTPENQTVNFKRFKGSDNQVDH